MNLKQFSEAMDMLDDKYISESLQYKKKRKRNVWIKWGSIAACVCAVLSIGILNIYNGGNKAPHPEIVQIANPIIEVSSTEEMEGYLDFPVPVLEKKADNFSVIVEDDYPTIGQIDYEDGSEYRIKYGSGDISGIYGGELEDTKEIKDVQVQYYTFSDTDSEITYAIWEQEGYTFSYLYTGDGESEIENLIEKFEEGL